MATAERPLRRRPTRSPTRLPPLEGYNVFEADRVLGEALDREGGDWAASELRELGASRRRREAIRARAARGEREPAEAAHPRPLRQPHRRGRVPPRLARADADRRSRTACTRSPWREPRPGRARRPRGAVHAAAQAEAGRRLPDLDDLLGDPGAAPAAGARGRVGAALPLAATTTERLVPRRDKKGALCGMGMTEKQGGSDVRANTTTARPLNGGGPGAEYELDRPQVVLLGADVRRVPRPRPGRGRALVLPAARASRPTASATASTSSGSRTSSATAPTPPARSSSAAPGRGWSARRAAACATIIEMVNHTRLDCVIGAAGRDAPRRRARDPPRRATARRSASCSSTSR